MSCTNCYNGCAQTVSDKCVRYTGVDITSLGISNGDTLLHVEQQLSTYLQSALNATGITLAISPSELCEIVSKYLPNVNNITALDLFKALKDASCDLQVQVTTLATTVESLNNYCTSGCCDTMCLIGLPENPTIKDVVMALVDKVCQLITDVAALGYDLETNYVQTANLNELIAIYLSSQTPENKNYLKMVPYVAYEYYGNLGGFGGTGIGTGVWEQVYLCNGQNGTPDRRGVVAVGVTNGDMGNSDYYSAVNPNTGNPIYTKAGTPLGTNTVQLLTNNLPSHNHPGTSAVTTISPNPHSHTIAFGNPVDANQTGSANTWVQTGNSTNYTSSQVNLTATTDVTVTTQGGNQAHNNYQPGIGCYYIMYIPNA
jgi:hypothetical protein